MNRSQISRIKKAKSLAVGGPLADSEATLCLYASDIDLDYISRCLGVEPTEAVRRGDIVGRRRPAPVGRWSLGVPQALSFEAKLQHLLGVTSGDQSTWDSLARTHDIQLRCVLYLHSWSEGFDLSPDIMVEIGRRHWHFGLSVYSAEGDEIVEAFLSRRPPN